MKFKIYNWAFEKAAKEKLAELGYIMERSHDCIVEDDIHEVSKKIYESGLNVMLFHNPNEVFPILFVDTKRFSQR